MNDDDWLLDAGQIVLLLEEKKYDLVSPMGVVRDHYPGEDAYGVIFPLERHMLELIVPRDDLAPWDPHDPELLLAFLNGTG